MAYQWTPGGVRRRFVWSAAICTALCLLTARPAFADPVPPGVPDAGSRPVSGGAFQPPGTSPTGSLTAAGGVAAVTPPPVAEPGPRGQEILTDSIALETVGQRLRKYDTDLAEAQRTADATHDALTSATAELTDLRERVGQEAGEAYKAATALGPLDRFATDLHQLSVLAPGLGQQPGGQATARELERAEANERAALAAYQAAATRADELTRTRDSAKADYDKRNVALTALRTQNSAEYQRELTALDAQQTALGAGMNIGGAVKGLDANPKAKRAVQHALDKLGSPYVWGAEGPTTFDCSGLVLWSYTQPDVGATGLPRVANEQYKATSGKPVSVDSLLPGDLLFFATDKSDWTTIHHVAIYVGNGKMVQAPTTGDVVKVSPIWWSEFYGATRVFDAVPTGSPAVPPAPHPTPAPTTPSPSPSGTPSPSPSPSGSPSHSPSPSPSPSPSDPPSPTPTPTPTPTPSESTSPPAAPPNSAPVDPSTSASQPPTTKSASPSKSDTASPSTTASSSESAAASPSESTTTSSSGSATANP